MSGTSLNFVFDSRASLTGCVICKSAHIGEKSELKDCLVGASHNVMAMGKLLWFTSHLRHTKFNKNLEISNIANT